MTGTKDYAALLAAPAVPERIESRWDKLAILQQFEQRYRLAGELAAEIATPEAALSFARALAALHAAEAPTLGAVEARCHEAEVRAVGACKTPGCNRARGSVGRSSYWHGKGYCSDFCGRRHSEALRAEEDRQRLADSRERELAELPDRIERKIRYEDRRVARAAVRECKAEARAAHARRRYSGPPRRGYVYVLMSSTGRLLYIGKTYNVRTRLLGHGGHAETKAWWPMVARVCVNVFATEADALAAEAHAIAKYNPPFNVARPTPPAHDPEPLAAYFGELY